jgi:hypothetical protein
VGGSEGVEGGLTARGSLAEAPRVAEARSVPRGLLTNGPTTYKQYQKTHANVGSAVANVGSAVACGQ